MNAEPLTVALANHGIPLRLVDELDTHNVLGTAGSSVCAQATIKVVGELLELSVEALEISESATYAILHEAAHILQGFDDELAVLEQQRVLAEELPEPWRSRGYEYHTSCVALGFEHD